MRAAYYICDPLISTSNPPTTHSCPGEPAFEAPRKPHFLATRIDYRDLPVIRVASIQPVLLRVSITRPSSPPSLLPSPLLLLLYYILLQIIINFSLHRFQSSSIISLIVRTTLIDRKSADLLFRDYRKSEKKRKKRKEKKEKKAYEKDRVRYDRAYPLSRVKSTDSDGLKCWKELVGRLPSATPNPRGGF